jgi:hypothetical protein
MTGSPVGRAILLLCGLVVGGLQLALSARFVSGAMALPTEVGSGGIGAVSAGCAEVLVEFGFVVPTIVMVGIAVRRTGRPGKRLALLLGISLAVGLSSGVLLFLFPRAAMLARALQYLAVGVITLLTMRLLTATGPPDG